MIGKTTPKSTSNYYYMVDFYLNISSGLAIISYEKYYYETAGIGIVLGLVFSAIFNSLGRFGVAWWSDYFKIVENFLE